MWLLLCFFSRKNSPCFFLPKIPILPRSRYVLSPSPEAPCAMRKMRQTTRNLHRWCAAPCRGAGGGGWGVGNFEGWWLTGLMGWNMLRDVSETDDPEDDEFGEILWNEHWILKMATVESRTYSQFGPSDIPRLFQQKHLKKQNASPLLGRIGLGNCCDVIFGTAFWEIKQQKVVVSTVYFFVKKLWAWWLELHLQKVSVFKSVGFNSYWSTPGRFFGTEPQLPTQTFRKPIILLQLCSFKR